MKKAAFLLYFFVCSLFYLQAQIAYSVFNSNDKQGLKKGEEIVIPASYNTIGWSEGLQIPLENVIAYQEKYWGLISLNGKIITPPKYYHLWAFHKDLIIAAVKGRFTNHIFFGAINSKGKAIIEFKYSSIVKKGNNLIVAEQRSGQKFYGLINEKNKLLLDVKYQNIKHFGKDLFVFTLGSEINAFEFSNGSASGLLTPNEAQKGIINSSGIIIIEPSLDSISNIKNGTAFIYKKGMVGKIDVYGKILMEAKYKSLGQANNENKAVAFDQWSVIDGSNELQTVFDCDSVKSVNDNYLIYRNNHLEILTDKLNPIFSKKNASIKGVQNNKIILSQHRKFGVIKQDGSSFIPFEYDSIHASKTYFYLQKKGKWSVWNQFGRKISKFSYDAVKPDTENLIAVSRRGHWGFIDFQGDEVIPLKFEAVSPFLDRIAKVTYLNSKGSVNQFGEWVCEPIYDKVEITTDGLSKAHIRRRIDLIGQTGNVLFQTFNHLRPHKTGFLEVSDEGLYGLISSTGKIHLYPEYSYISNTLLGDKLFVQQEEQGGVLSAKGTWDFVLTDRYEGFLGMNEGLYAVKIDGKYGFVDDQQRLRIANRYDSLTLFHEGIAAIKLRGNWGFINTSEKLIVQPHYQSVSDFINGLAIVEDKKKQGLINTNGNVVLPLKYDSIRLIDNRYHLIKNQKFGIATLKGTVIIPAEYDLLEATSGHQFIAKRRGKYGVMNDKGLFDIPLLYNKITMLSDDLYLCQKMQ